MEFIVQTEDIRRALNKVSFALSDKDELEAYTYLAFRISHNVLRINASNRNMVTEAKVHIRSNEDGVVLGVPGALITKIAKVLPKDLEASFKFDGINLLVKSARSFYKIPVLSHNQVNELFPPRTDYDANNIPTNMSDISSLMSSFKKVIHCVDLQTANSQFLSVYIDKDYFVAVDGLRLAMYPNLFNLDTYASGILIPADQVFRILKTFNGVTGVGGICVYGDGKVHIRSTDLACGINLRTGKFPNYKSILRNRFSDEISVPKDNFLESLRRVLSVHKSSDLSTLSVEIAESSLTISSSQDGSNIEDTILNVDHLLDYKFCVNGKFILEAVMNIEGANVVLYLHKNKESGVVEMIDIIEGEYRNVIVAKQTTK